MKIVKYFGPPGTGKTEKLRSIVEHEVKQGTPLNRIAYLSFTKGAAEVIRERMGATEADVKWFRTIHSACMTLLGIGRESVITYGDYIKFREETGMVVRSDEFDDWDNTKPLDYTPTKRAMELAAAKQIHLHEVIRTMPPHPNLTRQRADSFVAKWTEFKQRNHKFDFTDMLTGFLKSPSPLPCDVVILDEAQDLSELQWLIFELLCKNAERVYMAGDDDQAIYPFIGGSEYGFLDHKADEEHVLSKSYRVPREIGEVADRIIKKVGHRKAKAVHWRDAPGEVQRTNLDAFSLPWRRFLDEYKTIMVLTRHRLGARNFSDDLKTLGIPHDFGGEGIAAWKEAKIAETFLVLRDGGSVTVRAAKDMLKALDRPSDKLTAYKPRTKITRDLLPEVPWDDKGWVRNFGGDSERKLRRYEAIRKLVNNDGVEVLAKKPAIRISTMHAVKGDEAELVIIVPDCTAIVRQNMQTPGEIRLAYVALTRAQRKAVILIPRSDNYITHFFGG